MEKHKFKIGDRVRVIKIDNQDYYCTALYKVGDVGTIEHCDYDIKYDENDYCVRFDRLKANGEDPRWYALESWLELEKQVMVFE